jgi:hypothetical protein
MKAHKHAELIKAWADGAKIEFYDADSDEWRPCPAPSWYPADQYRIKPVERQRAYPMTQMEGRDLERFADQAGMVPGSPRQTEWKKYFAVANAALRQACDNGQVVPREEFDRAVGDRKARDMAVAKEVVKSLCWVFGSSTDARFDEAYLLPVIARANP